MKYIKLTEVKSETQKNEQALEQQKLQARQPDQQKEHQTSTYEGRIPSLAQKLREALLLEEDPIQAAILKEAYNKEILRLIEKSK